MKLIDRIRTAQETLDERLAAEQRQIKEAQERLEREEYERGGVEASWLVDVVASKIMNAVDERVNFYMYPVGRGRNGPQNSYEKGFTDFLIKYFTNEGLNAELKTLKVKSAVGEAIDYEIRFSW